MAIKTLDVLRKNQPTLSLLVASYVTDPFLDWTVDKNEAVGVNPGKREVRQEDGQSIGMIYSVAVWVVRIARNGC